MTGHRPSARLESRQPPEDAGLPGLSLPDAIELLNAPCHALIMTESQGRAAVSGEDLTGKFWLSITRSDGTGDVGYPVVRADGTWIYYVPAGVRMVGTAAVESGDTVSGRIEVSPW